MSFFGLLTIVFITLKLTGFIAWSWAWVLAPIWGPLVIWFAVCAFFYIGEKLLDKAEKDTY